MRVHARSLLTKAAGKPESGLSLHKSVLRKPIPIKSWKVCCAINSCHYDYELNLGGIRDDKTALKNNLSILKLKLGQSACVCQALWRGCQAIKRCYELTLP